MHTIPKVVAYIVRRDRLVVFTHVDDERFEQSGIQVPAGTIREGESPHAAVLREAAEETDLSGLRIRRYLGAGEYDMRPYVDAIHLRHYFHLDLDAEDVPERWSSCEHGDGESPPIRFECFWLPLTGAHVLAAGQGAFLGRLLENPQHLGDPAHRADRADELVHHVELWVSDLESACAQWAPVLKALGCQPYQVWDRGRSWRRGGSYLVLEQSRDLVPAPPYDRMRAGLNHLAVRGTPAAVDVALAAGWSLRISTDTAYHLINGEGFELEIVTG